MLPDVAAMTRTLCYIFGHVWKVLTYGMECRRCGQFRRRWFE
jgi:hypothetical protein